MAGGGLSQYLGTAMGNIQASLAAPDHWTLKIVAVDACLHELTDDLTDGPDVLTSAFALDAHSRLSAAALLALAGAMDETYAVARSALESAMYANLLSDSDSVRNRWFKRDEDPASRRTLRSGVSTARLIDAVARRDPDLAVRVRRVYEDAITFGAHPNVGSIAGSMQITEHAEHTEFVRAFLGGHGVEIAAARKHLVVTGISVIEILSSVMPELSAKHDLAAKLVALKASV